ncbi:hypothetical protein BDK51DRAFT_47888 [Blyttiomyces helicus]|uniref:Uncharacterized protein n=1 Tax=Blyttiomyces helicus TaxID=388810 RepID=A0A4P9WQR0_9FUNG|nr:hypothetical protein BDK51DRAFT_47888 [Blyttiomyces helicus]|eukprot:RKO93560.1 hypothetical protein BDK51DRAFT_47888 [Blyttiomyces helicus]
MMEMNNSLLKFNQRIAKTESELQKSKEQRQEGIEELYEKLVSREALTNRLGYRKMYRVESDRKCGAIIVKSVNVQNINGHFVIMSKDSSYNIVNEPVFATQEMCNDELKNVERYNVAIMDLKMPVTIYQAQMTEADQDVVKLNSRNVSEGKNSESSVEIFDELTKAKERRDKALKSYVENWEKLRWIYTQLEAVSNLDTIRFHEHMKDFEDDVNKWTSDMILEHFSIFFKVAVPGGESYDYPDLREEQVKEILEKSDLKPCITEDISKQVLESLFQQNPLNKIKLENVLRNSKTNRCVSPEVIDEIDKRLAKRRSKVSFNVNKPWRRIMESKRGLFNIIDEELEEEPLPEITQRAILATARERIIEELDKIPVESINKEDLETLTTAVQIIGSEMVESQNSNLMLRADRARNIWGRFVDNLKLGHLALVPLGDIMLRTAIEWTGTDDGDSAIAEPVLVVPITSGQSSLTAISSANGISAIPVTPALAEIQNPNTYFQNTLFQNSSIDSQTDNQVLGMATETFLSAVGVTVATIASAAAGTSISVGSLGVPTGAVLSSIAAPTVSTGFIATTSMITGLAATPATAPLASAAFATLSGLSPLVFPVVAALAATGVTLFAVNGLRGKYIASLPDSSGDRHMSILTVNEKTQEVSAGPIPEELIPEVKECVGYLRDVNFTAENKSGLPPRSIVDLSEPSTRVLNALKNELSKEIIDVLAEIPALTSTTDQLENSRSEEMNKMPEHESREDESRKDERHEKDGIGLRDEANSTQGDKEVPSMKVEKVVIKKLDDDFVREPVVFISSQQSKTEINDEKISNISALPTSVILESTKQNNDPGNLSIDSRIEGEKHNIGKVDGASNRSSLPKSAILENTENNNIIGESQNITNPYRMANDFENTKVANVLTKNHNKNKLHSVESFSSPSDRVAINALSEKLHQMEKPSDFLIGMVIRNRNRSKFEVEYLKR